MASTLEHLLATPIPPTQYHAFPVIPVKGLIIVGAPSKSYKSFLTINMAYDLADGKPVLGSWAVDKPKTVLYIEQELGKYRLRDRLSGIHGYRASPIAGLNFFYASKDLVCKLDTTVGMSRIREHIVGCKPDIVIFDPLMWFHNQDENDNTSMHRVMEKLIELQEDYGHSTILVHHMSKPSETRSGDDANSLRGASSVFADADSVITISKPVRNDDTIIQLKFILRNTENPPPMTLQLDNSTKTFNRR